jgi:hypothetical protein
VSSTPQIDGRQRLGLVARVAAIGGLMAAGGGAIYVVASTRGNDDEPAAASASATKTPGTASPLTETPSSTGGPSETKTPPATTTGDFDTALTDTGYKAIDGSPLYAECVGINPSTGAPLPLPPDYPTPGPLAPTKSSPTEDQGAPPPAADIPAFDVASVAPSDTKGWATERTSCLGGWSFAVPPGWIALYPLSAGGYGGGGGAMYHTANNSVKVDINFSYNRDDTMTRFRNGSGGNGTYFIAKNLPVSIGGAPGLLDVSRDLVESPKPYVVVAYLLNPRPNWYLSYVGFFHQPYNQQSFADFIAMVNSTRFAP